MMVGGAFQSSAKAAEIQGAKTNLELTQQVNAFLEKEIVYSGKETRVVDLMTDIKEDESAKISFLKDELSKLLNPIQEKWWFELRTGENKIFSMGSGAPAPKQIGKFEGCTLPYLFGVEKLFENEYLIDLPHGGRFLLCY